MSAPPPGGTPPPQQPPQYPQYSQQPPPGYPPQYPQQPYYPQAAPPPPKSNTVLIIVIVVVVIIVALAALAWYAMTLLTAPITQTNITVTSVTFSINYPGSTHYFGTTSVSSCTTCPLTVSFLSNFGQTITLTNGDSVARNVTEVTISGTNFTIITTSPTLPTSIAAGATKSISVTIQPTTVVGGSYAITGIIDTT